MAFEPGFGAFKALCDNLLLNSCYRSVVPLPIAVGDRTGLLELTYAHEAGGDHHSLRAREWRTKRDSIESHYTQPVCAERLDDIVRRHHLPAPHAIRIAVRSGAEAVLTGAIDTLRTPQLRSVLVSVKGEAQAKAVIRTTEGCGFTASMTEHEGDDHGMAVCLERTSTASTMNPPLQALRRAAERLRRSK